MSELTRKEIKRVMREFLRAKYTHHDVSWFGRGIYMPVYVGSELASPSAAAAILREVERLFPENAISTLKTPKIIYITQPFIDENWIIQIEKVKWFAKTVHKSEGRTYNEALFRLALAIMDSEDKNASDGN